MVTVSGIVHAVPMRPLAVLVVCFAGLDGCVQAPLPYWLTEPRPVPAEAKRVPLPAWQTIGQSMQGRPIRYRRVGTGHRIVLWIGGIHGDEIEGTVATRELPGAFLREHGLPARVSLHIIEDMNPDGRAARRRGNSRGVDLNRDFPASNRRSGRGLSQSESRVVYDAILKLQPDLVIVAHSWRGRYFINYDGPARRAAMRFEAHSGYPVTPSSSIAATPGSMGSWCGWDMSIPILTVEWKRGTPPDVAWLETRKAILAVIRGE
jgi:hypothetical protein